MTEMFRRFEPTPSVEREGEEPVTFEIGDESFTCIPNSQLPVGAIRRLSQERWTISTCCAFIEGVLQDKDDPKDAEDTQIERFRSTLERKDMVVDIELLSDLTEWLMGAITSRPTNSPSGSTGGQKKTGTGSKAKRGGKAVRALSSTASASKTG